MRNNITTLCDNDVYLARFKGLIIINSTNLCTIPSHLIQTYTARHNAY